MDADGQKFPIVARDVGFKVLGTIFTLNGSTQVEFDNRMRSAYAKFNSLYEVLGKRDANIQNRLQLFQATVTQSALWCSESWTLTVAQKRHLRAVRRGFSRRIAGPRRAPEQDYVSWIQNATKKAEERARDAGVDCWLKQVLRRRWDWAGRLARMSGERLAYRTTFWRDSEWWQDQPRGASAYGVRPMRARPGNFARWEDDLMNFAAHKNWQRWQSVAKQESHWGKSAEEFVNWAWR